MKFIAYYKDPEKKRLQRWEVVLLVLIAPVSLVWGARTRQDWVTFREAEQYYIQGDAHLHEGRTSEAITALEQCVSLRPDFYGAWEALGVSHHMLGQHDKELQAYKRAVASLPERGELHRELAVAYHESGDHTSELVCLGKAQDILGEEEPFTMRLLKRAQREADGTYPTVATGPRPEPPPAILAPLEHDHHHGPTKPGRP